MQRGSGKVSELVEQRKRNLALEEIVKERKRQKAEREALLERCMKEKGISVPAFHSFRLKHYCELYAQGKLEILSPEEVCLLLQHQEHTLNLVSEEALTEPVAVSITAHLVALHKTTSTKRLLCRPLVDAANLQT